MLLTSVNKPVTKSSGSKKKGGAEVKKEDKSEKLKCIEFHSCHEMGHYANKCPLRKPQVKEPLPVIEDGDAEVSYHVNGNWQSVIFNTTREVSVQSVLDQCIKIEPNDMILDNGADISIFNSKFLCEVEPCEGMKVHHVRGLSMIVNKTRYLDGFFRVHSSDTTKINVLSCAECEDKYEITCLYGKGLC